MIWLGLAEEDWQKVGLDLKTSRGVPNVTVQFFVPLLKVFHRSCTATTPRDTDVECYIN
jgi:hypothetical protein